VTRPRRRIGAAAWLALVVIIAAALAAARCGVDVVLGVDPRSDAALTDAGDASVGE
jgi:hypothetical protein